MRSRSLFTLLVKYDNVLIKRMHYASDLSGETSEETTPLLHSVRRRARPTMVDLYEVFCAALYLLRAGCQWRFLPSDFPKWGQSDQHGMSVLERALENSGWRGPLETGAQRQVDAQSVKNTDTAGSKGYDAGKKITGIKRHIDVGTQGLLHAIAVTTAEVADRKGRCRRCCSEDREHVLKTFGRHFSVKHVLC